MLAVGLLVAGCPKKNSAPDVPSVPHGPAEVLKDSLSLFSASAVDPDGDSVCIRFDWGDNDTSGWSPYVASDETVALDHAWDSVGVCSVRAQARDPDSMTSGWSAACAVQVAVTEDTWSMTFGSEREERAYSVQQTSDGGYVVAGEADSYAAGGLDVWLIRTDAEGDKLWSRVIGGMEYDGARSVQQTSDGGYIVAGTTESHGASGSDMWLIKTDASGREVWAKAIGGADHDNGFSVQQTSDGGYFIAGWTFSSGAGGCDLWLVKTDTAGNVVWDKTYGGSYYEMVGSARQTSDGGYVITGLTCSFGAGGRDVWLVKTDSSGDTVWTRTFGGAEDDWGQSVRQTADGGYVIAGITSSYGAGREEVWLIKTDAGGNAAWAKTFGGASSDCAYSVQQTADRGYVIAGSTESYGSGQGDVWLIRTDAGGNRVWDRTFGGLNQDWGHSVWEIPEGYVVAGSTSSFGAGGFDVWLIKTSGP